MVAMGILIALAGVFAYAASVHRENTNTLIRVTGIPPSVSTPLASLMALSPIPVKLAPTFTLVDQNGHTLSLSSFRGRVVVLEFMDTHCTDICPIVSQEFIDAYHNLGAAATHVVFVAINVNKYHARVADVAAFSKEHQLNSIPSWHFFTGSVAALSSVWKKYGILVQARSPNADIIHSSFVFFIDPNGQERYLANPMDYHTSTGVAYLPTGQLTSWGQGIALVARSLTH
jgi:cytochrome oxidase Cu insertion factor (SCO1/SenC/PrrC family)